MSVELFLVELFLVELFLVELFGRAGGPAGRGCGAPTDLDHKIWWVTRLEPQDEV